MHLACKQLLLVALVFWCLSIEAQDAKRPFSVRDSIEMSTFSDPFTRNVNATCQQSPDGRHIFFVTTRGLVARNQLRSTIWILNTVSIHSYLATPGASPPLPRILAERTVTPRVYRSNSYGSVILKAQWSSDSSSILFLAEEPDGLQHLYRVSIQTGVPIALTGPNENIQDYSESAGTILYSVKGKVPLTTRNKVKPTLNSSARRLTGLSLTAIIQPDLLDNPDSVAIPRNLWLRKEGGNPVQINRSTGLNEWHVPSALSTQFRPAISPNGHAAIAAMPARNIPPEWNVLKFASDLYSFDKLTINRDPTGTIWSWPWQYVYVDLDHENIFPLVDAPSAMQAAYYDPFEAAWSSDGRRALFTNSFMPPTSGEGQLGIPCAVAVFTVSDHRTECVTVARYPKTNTHLISARFGPSSNEIFVNWQAGGTNKSESYREIDNVWTLMTSAPPRKDGDRTLSVSLKQDVGLAPTLWAEDKSAGIRKQLWNPNRQLGSLEIGEASVYRWKDSTGYEWVAGLVKPIDYIPGRRYPLVIQTHGFFNDHEFLVDGSFTTGFAAQPLAASGFVVLQMGDRADRHIKPASEEAVFMATAFRDAVQQLDNDGLVDATKVGIIGFSRTSWYVETALIQYPRLFAAATVIDGVDESYMTYMLFCTEYHECRVDHDAVNGGPPFGGQLRSWLNTADGFNLDRIRTPLRIETMGPMSILGEWELYSSLSMQGKIVDLIDIPGGQHILQAPLERYASQQGDSDWFRFWLQGYERPDVEDHDQYRVWEGLKQSRESSQESRH
jgi:dipeptidyl aminopeptidase/acylaminoacyl peptidase